MKRMALAIDRAIHANTSAEKERAARWAAAWGLLCGIHTAAARLRSSEVQIPAPARNRRDTDQPGHPVPADISAVHPICLPQQAPASAQQATAIAARLEGTTAAAAHIAATAASAA